MPLWEGNSPGSRQSKITKTFFLTRIPSLPFAVNLILNPSVSAVLDICNDPFSN